MIVLDREKATIALKYGMVVGQWTEILVDFIGKSHP